MGATINGRTDDTTLGSAATAASESTESANHVHSRERWMATLSGTVNRVATTNGTSGFVATAGNDTYGTAILILDTADTPVIAGKTKFDLHRLFVTDVGNTSLYRVRLIYNGTVAADSVTSGYYTETIYRVDATSSDRKPLEIQMPRMASGTKVWASVWCAGQNAQSFTFLFGLHEYTS